MFDNIAVSWKAPGAADFAPVYENDFSTRRYRTLSPAGTTVGAYALAPTTNSVQSAYYGCLNHNNVYSIGEASSRYLVPNKTGGHGTLQQIGTDGWRRFDGPLMFTLVNPSYDSAGYGWSNGTVLRPTAASTGGGVETAHGHIAAPLGTALTSGKVRLYFDIMTPHTWHFPSGNSTAWAGVYIGSAHDATLINNSNDAKVILTNKYAFGGGYYINGSNGGTTSSSKWLASTGTTPLSIVNDGSPGQARWYRFRLTGDLEAKTYDIVAWFCGATSGKGADAYGIDDTSFMTDDNVRLNVSGRGFSGTSPSALDSVIISVNNASAYDQHGKRSGDTLDVGHYPLFDNIRVCRVNDDGTDGADIYTCDFEYGVRTSVRDAAPLATATDREGADRWIRRGAANGILNVIDAGGGDGVVSMTGVGWASNDRTMFAVQPFGSVTKNCSSVDFAADIRPPACFSAEKSTTTVSSGYARVEVGGDDYEQGVYCPASSSSWRSLASRIGFGFTAVSGKDACTQFTNVVISVQARNAATLTTTNSTAAIDTSHWYRFRVKANPTNAGGTFTVKVYDQGAIKPTANAADGTLVETFADLALPVFPEPGMTTFGLAASNFTGTRGGGLDDPNIALVDNLSATFNPAAFVLILR